MRPHHLIAALVVFLYVGSSAAQSRAGNLKVRVTFTDGRACTIKVMVRLMLSAGNTDVAETYTNDQGLADFDEVEVGNYHLVISGDGIQTTDSGLFEVDNRRGTQFQTISVRRTDEDTQNVGGTVAVQDMKIPSAAKKPFRKANDLIAQQNWKKAIEQLNRAIAIYPKYAEAYNNLGVVYARMGDRADEKEALQKALNINDHFAAAWVNLARMSIVDRDFPQAESLLDKAAGLDPTDSQTLMILANVELMNLHYQQAIGHCQKTHALGQDSHSLVHFIAARAYEHESQIPQAISELKMFLKEEPDGIRAQAARKELTALQHKSGS